MRKDEVIKELKAMHSYFYQFDDDRSVRHCEALQTAITAMEYRSGQWRHYEGMLTCSECGTEYYDNIMEYCGDNVPRHCPHCGANMELHEEENVDCGMVTNWRLMDNL